MLTGLMEPPVAKKKQPKTSQDDTPKRIGRPPSDTGTRDQALVVRCRTGWKLWTVALAEFCRMDTSDMIDHALVEFAKSRGFELSPPKR